MKVKCKCGRAMVVDGDKHAGKRIACQACGQRYRLPSSDFQNPETKRKPWKEDRPDNPPLEPTEVGAIVLGEKISFLWIFVSIFITLLITIGGVFAFNFGLKKGLANEDFKKYFEYAQYAVMWAPCLAFVISGWITARLSPGRTIAEPAIGAVLSITILFGLAIYRPGPIDGLMADMVLNLSEGIALKVNLFSLAMFNGAMLSCAGAYFGEVAQERSKV